MLLTQAHQTLFDLIDKHAKSSGTKVYLVGGVVRDLLLGKAALDEDVDFLVEGNAINFANGLIEKTGGQLKKFEAFFTAKIVGPVKLDAEGITNLSEIDFASARTETYKKPGALPEVCLATITDDLKRRDFSINAIAIEVSKLLALAQSDSWQTAKLAGACFDPFNGLQDLAKKKLRILHSQSFIDDPTRICRLARYLARLNAEIDKDTAIKLAAAIQQRALDVISLQRTLSEIKKVMEENSALIILNKLEEWGALYCLERLSNTSSNIVLRRFNSCVAEFLDSTAEDKFWLFLRCLIDEGGVDVWREKIAPLGFKRTVVQQNAVALELALQEPENGEAVEITVLRAALFDLGSN